MSDVKLHSDDVDDVATSSNFRVIRVNHYHFDMDINFTKKEITSSVKLSCQVLQPCNEVILDIHDTLLIKAARLGEGRHLEFTTKPFSGYGSTVIVHLDKQYESGAVFEVTVDCIATGGPGVVWLDPVQTAGKKMPYVYSQGQAVMNRSFFPCQDTPAVKCTFHANVTVPPGFTVLMSGNKSNFEEMSKMPPTDESKHFTFSQSTPIPCYLIAMAAGDIQGARIGPRSTVYAEPSLLERAKNEFDGAVEEFLVTGERLFGPYVWERYDILVMPPSFPFGGMENPCLTFVTPCLLVGDKSLTDVIIHEISHSWFGNLVTNATWGEFWLNEGFTMFAQRRITEELYGEEYMCLEASVGLELFDQTANDLGQDHPLTCLRVIIAPGVDPDDTYNETPYEKGYCFVSYLQELAGGKEQFTAFLKDYVKTFQYKSIVAEDTLEHFLKFFPHLKEAGVHLRAGFEFDTWLTQPGHPPFRPDLSAKRTLTDPADRVADQFSQSSAFPVTEDIQSWKTYQVVYLLDKILEKSPLPPGNIDKFINAFPSIISSDNSEIRLRWSRIVIRNDFKQYFDIVRQFLHSQGKIKYTVPVYRELVKGSDSAKQLAHDVYAETKPQLHIEVIRRLDGLF